MVPQYGQRIHRSHRALLRAWRRQVTFTVGTTGMPGPSGARIRRLVEDDLHRHALDELGF
jgi:hypothetical protein